MSRKVYRAFGVLRRSGNVTLQIVIVTHRDQPFWATTVICEPRSSGAAEASSQRRADHQARQRDRH